MRIELLVVPECPNQGLAYERILEAVSAAGISDAVVTTTVITADEQAALLGLHGSPTILVDGVDPFPVPEGEGPSVSCRRYDTGQRLEGAPSVEQLAAALTV